MILRSFITSFILSLVLSTDIELSHIISNPNDTNSSETKHYISVIVTQYSLTDLSTIQLHLTSKEIPIYPPSKDNTPQYSLDVFLTEYEGSLEVTGDKICTITLTDQISGGLSSSSMTMSWDQSILTTNLGVEKWEGYIIYQSSVSTSGANVTFRFSAFGVKLHHEINEADCKTMNIVNNRSRLLM